ncbi:MAG: PQQ-binding-like beta-propeller repeat protein [Bacteroidota bacterium]
MRAFLLIGLGLLELVTLSRAVAQDTWPMKGHDVRRTGQSQINGPQSLVEGDSWTTELPGAHTVNIGATVTEDGAFFGSWGLLRRDPAHPTDPRLWDKSDGQMYGLELATGASLWGGPVDLDLVPRCYDYAGRGPNVLWCGLTPYEVSFYNGTIEGQAAYDVSRDVLYVGRGDGKLYALDPDTGATRWRYVTFNPELPDDPDGGGEIVTAPLVGPDGTVYVGSWGEGEHETHAVYAINPDGTLRWRYPSASSLDLRVYASPALSPDGATVYISSYRGEDANLPASLYAFDPTGTSDVERLRWSLGLELDGLPVYTTTLAVGSDGVIYVGGLVGQGFGVPVVLAVSDSGTLLWSVRIQDGAQFIGGIALREVGGETQHLVATTANLGTAFFNAVEAGGLYALDLDTGAELASYDPSDDVPEAIGGLNSPAIGADGMVYIGVRGRFGDDAVPGQAMGVRYDEAERRFELAWNVVLTGYVEWNHPAIGPDGGIYIASSSVEETVRTATYDEGVTPEGTTAWFHALKGPTGVATEYESPARVRLGVPFPNPISPHTRIPLELAQAGPVRVDLVDALGRTVHVLHDGSLAAGPHTLSLDGFALAPGAYGVRLRAGEVQAVRWVVRGR